MTADNTRIPYDAVAQAVRSLVQLRAPLRGPRGFVDDAKLDGLDRLATALARGLQASGVGAEAAMRSAHCFVMQCAEHARAEQRA